jgi:hypothetical protein
MIPWIKPEGMLFSGSCSGAIASVSGGHFSDQQGVVKRIDDTRQRRSAFLACKGVTLEAAGVDDRVLAAAKREACAAARASDRLSAIRFAGLGPVGDDAIVTHRCVRQLAESLGGEF